MSDTTPLGKETSGQRLTYLLRPNVTRPSYNAVPTLDTPPVTDLSELSANDFDTESELVSDRDTSEVEGPAPPAGLTAIVELGSDASAPASPVLGAVYATRAGPAATGFDSDEWSVLGESDAEGDLSEGVAGLADEDAERTPMAAARRRQSGGPDALRSRLLERQRRSASSPSRSSLSR